MAVYHEAPRGPLADPFMPKGEVDSWWEALNNLVDVGAAAPVVVPFRPSEQLKGETMGWFSGITNALKGAFNIAKTVAPIAADFVPGGTLVKTGIKLASQAVEHLGAERTAATAASRAWSVDEIIRATQAAGGGTYGATGTLAERAAGIRVKPGVGKVLKVGAGTVAAGAGIGISEEAFAQLYDRITGRKNTNALTYAPIQNVRVLAGEGEEYGAASRPQRRRKARTKKLKKTKRTRSRKGRSAAQVAALKKAQAGLKRWRRSQRKAA